MGKLNNLEKLFFVILFKYTIDFKFYSQGNYMTFVNINYNLHNAYDEIFTPQKIKIIEKIFILSVQRGYVNSDVCRFLTLLFKY